MEPAASHAAVTAPTSGAVIELAGDVSCAGLVVMSPTAIRAAGAWCSVRSFDRAVFLAPTHLADDVDLRTCRFGTAVGLENLRFPGARFTRVGGRAVTADGSETTYRQLRRAAASSGRFDLAADFHMGELESRRVSAVGIRRVPLTMYRVFGGYGHRPLRPFLAWLLWGAFVATLMTTWPSRFVGGGFTLGGAWIDTDHWVGLYVKFVLRTSIAVFSPLEHGDIHTDGYILLLVTKVVSTALLVLCAMGVRSRLRR